MSWSISKLYRNPAEVRELIVKEQLPSPIEAYITIAADELGRQHERSVNARGVSLIASEQPMVLVHGHGHLCHEGPGGGNYEVTTAKLVVTPLRFGATMALPLQVV